MSEAIVRGGTPHKKNVYIGIASTKDPILLQSCSAFDENGDVVFHENVFRAGSVTFNLTPQSRQPSF